LRKKVKNENDDNTSDDESQLSSSEQQMVGNVQTDISFPTLPSN